MIVYVIRFKIYKYVLFFNLILIVDCYFFFNKVDDLNGIIYVNLIGYDVFNVINLGISMS